MKPFSFSPRSPLPGATLLRTGQHNAALPGAALLCTGHRTALPGAALLRTCHRNAALLGATLLRTGHRNAALLGATLLRTGHRNAALLGVALFSAALLLNTTPAQAQPSDPAAPSTPHDQSRALFRAGNESWVEGNKVKAKEEYKKAFELEESWDVACNLGRAEGELGLDAEALGHLDICLKEYPPSTEERVQKARAKFFDLRVEIRDRCKKMGCSYRDPAPASGLSEPVVPVAATAAAEPKPTESKVPEEFAPPPEGKPHRASAKWPVVISVGAAGALGLGLGGGFFVMSEDKKNEATSMRDELIDDGIGCETGSAPECADYQAAKQSYFDLQTAGIVAVSVGGGLLVASGVMALVWPERRSGVAQSLQPIVSIGERSSYFGISGRF